MKERASTFRAIAVETFFAAAVCTSLGLLVYGLDVLNIYRHKFVFISYGLTGAFTFYSLRRLRPRDTLIFVLVIFLFQSVLLTRSVSNGKLLLDFIFFVPIPMSCAIFFWSYRKRGHEVVLYDPLILGAFAAATIAIARAFVTLKWMIAGIEGAWLSNPASLLGEVIESFLIGAGLGIGFWLLDRTSVKKAFHLTKGFTARPA